MPGLLGSPTRVAVRLLALIFHSIWSGVLVVTMLGSSPVKEPVAFGTSVLATGP